MNSSLFSVGTKVRLLRDFYGINKGDIGYIIEDYGNGVTVAWCPLPMNKTLQEISQMYGIDPDCPRRDGFSNDEFQFLEVIED